MAKRRKGFRKPDTSKMKPQGGYERNEKNGTSQREFPTKNPFNDYSWYSKYPSLLESTAKIPFPYRPGMSMSSADVYTVESAELNTTRTFNVPGILTINWMPNIGQSEVATDPIGIAAKEIYAKVRAAFSGSLDADPPDFMVYLMSLNSIFSYIASLKRVYRIINAYSPENYLVPEGLLQALGFSEDQVGQLIIGKTKLWSLINQLVYMTRKYTCPAVFPLFNRHYWLNDNVYADSDIANSQWYVFRQEAFYKFAMLPTKDNATITAGGLMLQDPPGASAVDIVEALYSVGLGLINALADSDDAYTISGYLKRAYDGFPQFTVDLLDQYETFSPLYVPEVLAQIENCVCVLPKSTILPGQYGGGVQQWVSRNTLVRVGQFIVPTTATNFVTPHPQISLRTPTPSVEQIVEASRLSAYLNPVGTSTTTGSEGLIVDPIASTEIPTYMYITMVVNGVYITRDFDQVTSYGANRNIVYDYLTSFDWHPRVVGIYPSSSESALIWDVHNVTSFTPEQLRQIHRVCTFSLFNAFNE